MAPLLTPTIAACLAISGGVHVVVYLLNATLPLHLVDIGGSKPQVGLLFAVATTVLSGSFDLGSVIGSLLVGFTVERVSFAAGFHLAAGRALAGLALFVLAERRAILRGSMAGV